MDGSGRGGGGGVDMFLPNYKMGKTLGIGSFGKVKIAEHVLTSHKVAIKILNRRKIKNMEMEEKGLSHLHANNLYSSSNCGTRFIVLRFPDVFSNFFNYCFKNIRY